MKEFYTKNEVKEILDIKIGFKISNYFINKHAHNPAPKEYYDKLWERVQKETSDLSYSSCFEEGRAWELNEISSEILKIMDEAFL